MFQIPVEQLAKIVGVVGLPIVIFVFAYFRGRANGIDVVHRDIDKNSKALQGKVFDRVIENQALEQARQEDEKNTASLNLDESVELFNKRWGRASKGPDADKTHP